MENRTFIVTGGAKGIGFAAVQYLRNIGGYAINIDWDNGDISADLGTPKGREYAIETITYNHPDGIDGLILNAGIGFDQTPSRVLSINYFGTITLAEGLFELLRKKRGKCVVTVSGFVAYTNRSRHFVDALLANCGDETRIAQWVDSFMPKHADVMYGSAKIALVRWMRRVAPSWAARGVNINAVAPGYVQTAIVPKMEDETLIRNHYEKHVLAKPMPTVYTEERLMTADEVGPALSTLVLPEALGICGEILFCDGGTSALLRPEKFY